VIDRESERKRLLAAAEEAPQLVVMRGRRRVGKSFLIDHAYRDRRLLYYQADEGSEQAHLQLLAEECERLSGAPVVFSDWEAALRYLPTLTEHGPLIVALDEFQWMYHARPTLPSTIMRHYDHWQRRRIPIAMIISGSALSLMEQLVEGDQPMFGRAQYRPLIEPFDYRWAGEFGPPDADAEQRLLRYAILGGTAQYQVWAGRSDLETVLKERILNRDMALFEEPLQLVRGESSLREPGNYYALLRSIAGGATRYGELASTAGAAGTLLTDRLRRLEELGYIELRRPVAGNGGGHYEITDPFFRFWFRYVYPNRSRLLRGRVDQVCADVLADLDNFMGPIFERVCRDWASRYAEAEQFAGAQRIGAYWTRTHDLKVDVVGVTGNRIRSLGSCKWSRSADGHDLDRLQAQQDQIRGAGSARLGLFARGFHADLEARAHREDVALISVADLYA
jgi:uncharacterized protein